jgi:tyrosine-protein phosphatase SIW14
MGNLMRAFRLSSIFATIILGLLSFTILSSVQAQDDKPSNKVRIKNFGCLNETFYRGAQPKDEDYSALAALGVKTVIDLQKNGEDREQAMVESNGMRFYRIGMSDKSRPASEQAELFLKIVNDPANQPVFVHCAGGRHRTGAMSAIYRMTHDGWTADQAFQEMKRYDFEYGMGHKPLKHFVYDYYSHIDQKNVVVNTSSNR